MEWHQAGPQKCGEVQLSFFYPQDCQRIHPCISFTIFVIALGQFLGGHVPLVAMGFSIKVASSLSGSVGGDEYEGLLSSLLILSTFFCSPTMAAEEPTVARPESDKSVWTAQGCWLTSNPQWQFSPNDQIQVGMAIPWGGFPSFFGLSMREGSYQQGCWKQLPQ